MNIDGLSRFQVALLDIMWGIDGVDEYLYWKSCLPESIRAEINVLEELVVLADIDDMIETGHSLNQADTIINKIKQL